MERTPVMTGGCQCGAVRYAMYGELDQPHLCHCRMCQKAVGGLFSALAANTETDFVVTRGRIAAFRSSDIVERGFCRDCGTPLTFRYLGSGRVNVSIGSMDEPARVVPEFQMGIEARVPWFAGLPGLYELTTEAAAEHSGHLDAIAEVARTSHQHPDHDTPEWPARNESR